MAEYPTKFSEKSYNDKQTDCPARYEPSHVLKLTTSRLEQAINELALDVIAYDAFPMAIADDGSGYREDYISSLMPRYLNNRAQSIFGGSDEVQLNIIAKAILRL